MYAVFKRAILVWVPLAIALTGVCGVVYASVQQSLRQTANDPQIQMAEDAAATLDSGAAPTSVLPARQGDLSTSLDSFVMVFDADHQLVASSASLHGSAPAFPGSALATTGQDRITWQ